METKESPIKSVSFMDKVRDSKCKKKAIEELLNELINNNKFFTNEDIDMDGNSYQKWNSYEYKLIKQFLDKNTHCYKVGDLLDEEIISNSQFSRRKKYYSKYSKKELLNIKKAEERDRRISEILYN